MSRARAKICGITTSEDLDSAVKAGADAIGFVIGVPESPRNISFKKALELIRSTPIFVVTVTVIVSPNIAYLEKICRTLGPDIIQIHGSIIAVEDIANHVHRQRLMGVVPVESDVSADNIRENTSKFDAVLLDSHSPGRYGGTGKTHDWKLSRKIRDALYPKPVVLGGGLTPENVEEAINTVKPFAVDVSSGVESYPGKKDKMKMFEFVRKTKGVVL